MALLAFAATLSLASCVQDVTDDSQTGPMVAENNAITFTIASKIATRAADETEPVEALIIPLGDPVDGHQIYFEETVTTLDGFCADVPETRGTPVYTQNFSSMFSSFSGVGYTRGGTTPVVPDGAFTPNGNSWKRRFDSDPFAGNDSLFFFLRAPESATGVSGLSYSVARSFGEDRAVTRFHYVAPLDANSQQDLLFAGRSVKKEEKDQADILFYHALTGVKFRTDNTNTADAKTYITKVEFPSGLFREADFTITPVRESGAWVDQTGNYSSAYNSNGLLTVNTSNARQLNSEEVFSVSFDESDLVDFAEGGSFEHNGLYPSSFSAAGDSDHPSNLKNLNDTDASKTFWFIPVKMNNSIVLDVTFHVVSAGKDSGPIKRRVEIGKLLTGNVTWKAGELRTFTLKADLMDVDITDQVSGFEKTNVVITNTGNVDAFIRAHIVANWYGKTDNEYGVATGYTSATDDGFVDGWRMSEDLSGDNFGGQFTGLPGTGWEYNPRDGFFYHTALVPAGTNTQTLFTKYTLDTNAHPIPEIWYFDGNRKQFTDVELVMEIPVQSVEGEPGQTYKQAWEAVGVTF